MTALKLLAAWFAVSLLAGLVAGQFLARALPRDDHDDQGR